MKLVYGGPIDEVEVPAAGVVARRGEPVDVPDEVAELLLEQETWSRAEQGPKRRSKGDEG
jgi:hypothetical protein